MNKMTIHITFLFVFISTQALAQFKSEEDRLEHANELFENKSFIEAEPHMLHFLSTKNNAEFNFKYGVCALFKYADKTKAIGYLRKSIKDKNVDPQAYFYLARAQHYNYLFTDAYVLYDKYKSLADSKEATSLNLDMYMSMCKSGQSLMSNMSNLIVVDKTSTAEDKFQYSYNLEEIGGRILTTDLFQSKYDEKIGYKSIIYFPPLGQDKLFFSSYGKDGENGLDIFMVSRQSTGDWSEPVRLPESINTPYDDNFPYLQPDGKTLYFSSKGHNSMGGYDIFRCSYDFIGNNYGPVSNLDYKINSTDDDILYIVDDNNENAFFSSKRASDGGKIDVYNVKVKMIPIQNVVIAGLFKNLINDQDYKAVIKVQNVANNSFVGMYTVNEDRNYTILLPHAGKFKFIVETPLSEKIHAGLVDVKPQDGLKALKQEIELVNQNGEEKLVIINEFDQEVENEATILATVVKEMADPKINIDEIPDSILNPTETIPEFPVEDTISDDADLDKLLADNRKEAIFRQEEIDEIKTLSNKSKSIAEQKTINAVEKAKMADQIISIASTENNSNKKDSLMREAAALQKESQLLLEDADKSLEVASRYDESAKEKEEYLVQFNELNDKIIQAKESGGSTEELIEQTASFNEDNSSKSPIEVLQYEAKVKEQEANTYLNEAQSLRADQESLVYQIEKDKDALKFAKKKKDKAELEENISSLEERVNETELLIEEQFRLYEEAENKRKSLVNEADLMEEIQLSDKYDDVVIKENVEVSSVVSMGEQAEQDYISKNEETLADITPVSPTQNNQNEETVYNTIVDNDADEQEENIVEELIETDDVEQYNEVSETLENTTTEVEDFEDISQNIISYSNEDSQASSEELNAKKEEVVSLRNDITSLEDELKTTTNPKKIEAINDEITAKTNQLNKKEDDIVRSYEEINAQEIAHNEDKFESNTKDLSTDAKSDEDYLSAVYYMESAEDQKKKAKDLRDKANDPRTSPDEKNELLKKAHQHEMVAIDDQQTANNLLDDVQQKYPEEEEQVQEKLEEVDDVVVSNEKQEEQQETEEIIENSPITIPVSTEPTPVKVQNINGESFDPAKEPETFEVAAIADDAPIVDVANVSDPVNKEIIQKNQKSIDKVNDLSNQQETLEMQKNDLIDEKLIQKVDKKINKIEKKKAKSQLKMADDVAQVNQSEINKLQEQNEASKTQAETVSSDNFNYKQAVFYEESAEKLNEEALNYREEASKEKDPVRKAELLEQATSAENTAIANLKKSKKLYSDAIVENFSDDKLTVAKSVQSGEEKQSEQLASLSEVSSSQAKDYMNKAEELRNESQSMSKKERAKALVKADQYDKLAREEQVKADDFAKKSKKYKEVEDAMVRDIEIAENIENEDISYVAGSEEFKTYHEKQKTLNELEIDKSKKTNEQKAYQSLSQQLDAKADALDQQAKLEKNPIKKADLLADADQFRRESKKKKAMADALIVSIDSLDGEIRSKEGEQEVILSSLDSTSASQVRALAISGRADELINQIAQELPPNEESNPTEENVTDDDNNDTPSSVVSLDPVVPARGEITSNTYVPPSKVTADIIKFTEQEVSVYNEDNPIPVNPKLPDGLIYKVQVGAFRNPIPQDLFKGFAPISAEKVRDDITRYRVGYFTSYDVANTAKNQVRGLGYRDAFVVAINNGNRIKLSEARSLESNLPPAAQPIAQTRLSQDNQSTASIQNEEATEEAAIELADATAASSVNGIFYSVQVGAFSKPLTKDNDLNVTPLVVNRLNGLYKYSTGIFNTIEEAGRKKAALIDQGIEDAFIIAYNDGRIISLDQATSSNPDRVVEYQNPEFYYLDFGTYNDSTSNSIAQSFINLRSMNIRSRVRKDGKQFFSKKYDTREEAVTAQRTATSSGLENVNVVQTNRDEFAFNYEFKIDLGSYTGELPDEIKTAFNNLNELQIKAYAQGDKSTYLTISRNTYEEAITDQNACRMQNIAAAKIVVFKDGVPTTLDKVLNSFK